MKVRNVRQSLEIITIPELLERAQTARSLYLRLAQVHATVLAGQIELNYCFAAPDQWQNLRLVIDPQQKVPSISRVFPGAFIYENEIHDLFGVQFSDINIDYQGRLYRLRQQMPYAPAQPAGEASPARQEVDS